jgi:branched-chain amino acid transport system permease protein
VAAIVVADLMRRSRLGLELQASREDEPAALAVAIRVGACRAAAFVASAFVVGVGGALFAGAIGSFSPDAFYLGITFMTIAMLVVGGTRSLTGAVTGVLVISVVTELLRRAEQGFDLGVVRFDGRAGLREVGLAIVFLLILIIRPRGLTGGRELRLPSRLTGSPR